MDLLTFLVSFLGGGIASALIHVVYSLNSEQKTRKIKYLETQINELYGPAYYFTSQIKKLFELNSKFLNAYQEEFEVKADQYSQGEITQKRLGERADTTLRLANQYISYIALKKEKIEKIVARHYSLIDVSDIDIFLLFFEHSVRQDTEFDKNGKLITPDIIFKHLDNISFLPNDVIVRIEKRFLEKRKELDKLHKGNILFKDINMFNNLKKPKNLDTKPKQKQPNHHLRKIIKLYHGKP